MEKLCRREEKLKSNRERNYSPSGTSYKVPQERGGSSYNMRVGKSVHERRYEKQRAGQDAKGGKKGDKKKENSRVWAEGDS